MELSNRRKFVKQLGLGGIGIGICAGFTKCTFPETSTNIIDLRRSSPEKQGISSSAIIRFLDEIEASTIEFHSFMLLKNAHVVAEGWWKPFAPELKHSMYSLSKSFTSTAVGMLVDEGKLALEDQVISFFPDDLPNEISPNLADMKIKHLLTMTSGHADKPMSAMETATDGNWAREFLSKEITYKPGTHFLYNTGATYMLSAIAQSVCSQNILDFLSERLFKLLNIEGADWERDPRGICTGGYGLRLKTEDIAKFGQLYLQNGKWNNQQLISTNWIKEATMKQTDSQAGDGDWSQGYGYQFWRCKPQPGFYRGDGAFGQFCIVIPQYEVVIAITSESKDMQATMNLVWKHLLPALGNEGRLKQNRAEHNMLNNRLQQLRIPPGTLNTISSLKENISGKRYKMDSNEEGVSSISFSFENEICRMQIEYGEVLKELHCGMSDWIIENNELPVNHSLFVIPDQNKIVSKVAASAHWRNTVTLIIKLKFIENMHSDEWTCTFNETTINISIQNSLARIQNRPGTRIEWTGQTTAEEDLPEI